MNKQLIDAAPDLLEACLAAKKYYYRISGRAVNGDFSKEEWGGITTGKDLDDLFNDWMEKSFAAVKKATGS